MIDVSTLWKQTLGCYNHPNRMPFVPVNDIKIEYEQIDAGAQNSASIAVNDKADYSTEDDVMNLSLNYSYKVATLEQNAWGLNAEYSVFSGSPHIGWVSQVASGSNGMFAVGNEPTMTITWDELQLIKIPCIIITWNATLGEFARNFTVNCYNGSTLLWTKSITDNASVVSTVEHDLENYDKIEIIVEKWCLPNTRAKLQTISMGVVVTLGKSDLLNVECDQNSDLLAFELPDNSLSFEIDNVDAEWNPDMPTGRYAYLLERQKVSMSVAYKLNGVYEWHKIATGFMAEWNTPQNGISATFTARDLTAFMTQKFQSGLISGYWFGQTITLYELARNAFVQSDLPIDADGSVKWSIDDSLKDISIVIPYSTTQEGGQTINKFEFDHTNAEVIQLCASASNTVIRIDEYGNINIVPLAETQSDYLIDRFVSYANAEYENQKVLKSVLINDTWQSDIASVITGELQSIDNDLIQSQSQALSVASKIQRILGKRRVGNNYTNGATLNGEYRADVRLQPMDMILNENKYALNIIYVTGVKYTFAGAWRGSYEGRVIRSIPKADTDYLYYSGTIHAGGEY